MYTSRMTANGQVTIPGELRERLDLKPGDRVDFAPGPGRTLVLFARSRTMRVLDAARREEAAPGGGVSREELNVLLGDWPEPPRHKAAG